MRQLDKQQYERRCRRSGGLLPGALQPSHDDMNGGAGAVADYYLERFNPATTTFQLQGLSPSPATPAQAQSFVVSTDAAPPATAFAASGTYTAATCTPVSFAASTAVVAARPPSVVAAGCAAVAALQARSATTNAWQGPAALPAGTITPVSLGTLNPGQVVVLTFDVTINTSFSGAQVANQGSVAADGGIDVLPEDPGTAAANDPTVTQVVPSPGNMQIPRAHLPLVRR